MTRTDVTYYEVLSRDATGVWDVWSEARTKRLAERDLRSDAKRYPEYDWALVRVERMELKIVLAKKGAGK